MTDFTRRGFLGAVPVVGAALASVASARPFLSPGEPISPLSLVSGGACYMTICDAEGRVLARSLIGPFAVVNEGRTAYNTAPIVFPDVQPGVATHFLITDAEGRALFGERLVRSVPVGPDEWPAMFQPGAAMLFLSTD